MYRITAEGKERFAELLADSGPQSFDDDGFGVHLAFFSRTPAETRMRILEGRRRAVEERREGLRSASWPGRASRSTATPASCTSSASTPASARCDGSTS